MSLSQAWWWREPKGRVVWAPDRGKTDPPRTNPLRDDCVPAHPDARSSQACRDTGWRMLIRARENQQRQIRLIARVDHRNPKRGSVTQTDLANESVVKIV